MLSKRVAYAVRRYGLSHKRVLDVGCHDGKALQYFGPGSVGLELHACHAYRARARGLSVVRYNLNHDGLPFAPRSFDAIWASDILEHCDAPHRVLLALRPLLRPNGLLFAYMTMEPSNPLARLVLRHVCGFLGGEASVHYYQWTPRSAAFLLHRAGFRVMDQHATPTGRAPLDCLLTTVAGEQMPAMLLVARPDASLMALLQRSKQRNAQPVPRLETTHA